MKMRKKKRHLLRRRESMPSFGRNLVRQSSWVSLKMQLIGSVLLNFFGSTGITRTCSVTFMIVSGSYNSRGLNVQDILDYKLHKWHVSLIAF